MKILERILWIILIITAVSFLSFYYSNGGFIYSKEYMLMSYPKEILLHAVLIVLEFWEHLP